MTSIDYQEFCACEWGALGTGRIDSNKCPIHDMTRNELISWGVSGWHEVSQLEAEVKRLFNEAYSYELDPEGNRISWRALEADKDMIRMELEAEVERLRTAILLLLDHVDYTGGSCAVNEMVGATLPVLIIDKAKTALEAGGE